MRKAKRGVREQWQKPPGISNSRLYWWVLAALWLIFGGVASGRLDEWCVGLIPAGIMLFALRCYLRPDVDEWRRAAWEQYEAMRGRGYVYGHHVWRETEASARENKSDD